MMFSTRAEYGVRVMVALANEQVRDGVTATPASLAQIADDNGLPFAYLEHLAARDIERVVRLAVRRMLPKGPLGRQMLKKLKIYGGPTHPHSAQQPVAHELPARSRVRVTA